MSIHIIVCSSPYFTIRTEIFSIFLSSILAFFHSSNMYVFDGVNANYSIRVNISHDILLTSNRKLQRHSCFYEYIIISCVIAIIFLIPPFDILLYFFLYNSICSLQCCLCCWVWRFYCSYNFSLCICIRCMPKAFGIMTLFYLCNLVPYCKSFM